MLNKKIYPAFLIYCLFILLPANSVYRLSIDGGPVKNIKSNLKGELIIKTMNVRCFECPRQSNFMLFF